MTLHYSNQPRSRMSHTRGSRSRVSHVRGSPRLALRAFLTDTDFGLQRPPFGATLIPSGRPRPGRDCHLDPRAPCVPAYPHAGPGQTSNRSTGSYTSIRLYMDLPQRPSTDQLDLRDRKKRPQKVTRQISERGPAMGEIRENVLAKGFTAFFWQRQATATRRQPAYAESRVRTKQ